MEIRLRAVENGHRRGIARAGSTAVHWLSPGIGEPLPGWDWLTGRLHPEINLAFELDSPGCHVSGVAKSGKSREIREAMRR